MYFKPSGAKQIFNSLFLFPCSLPSASLPLLYELTPQITAFVKSIGPIFQPCVNFGAESAIFLADRVPGEPERAF